MAKKEDNASDKLYQWYSKQLDVGLTWNEMNGILVDKYRVSDDKYEKEMYDILIGLSDSEFEQIAVRINPSYEVDGGILIDGFN